MDFLAFNPLSIITPGNIFWLVFGVAFGLVVGALPGLGAAVGCALLLPITYSMSPATACITLMALFMASQYGGSISAVTLGIPGTSGAVVTVMDGYPMSRRGKPGLALGYSLYSSTIGGLFGCLVLIFLTKPLAKVAIWLADPELFLVGVAAILTVPALGAKNKIRCLMSVLMGLFVGNCIGLDSFTGAARFTFGNVHLSDGISIVAMLSGLFAMVEVFEMSVGDRGGRTVSNAKDLKCHVPWNEYKHQIVNVIRSSVIGSVFGVIPGLGASAGTFVAYGQSKKYSKHPEEFGNGSMEGLSAAEACNNAVVGGALVPELALGIPGTASLAILGSALMMHGINPGPNLMSENTDLVYTLYWGLIAATILMFIFGKYLTSLIAQVLRCPNYVLIVIVAAASLVGAQAARGYQMDVWLALGIAVIFFILKRLDFSIAAFTMGMVLANLIENRFRRGLMYNQGSFNIFFSRPICWVLWILVLYMVASILIDSAKQKKKASSK